MPIELVFDAYTMTVEDDFLVIVFFSKNLGSIKVRLPLDNLADYFGAIGNALREIEEGNN